MIIIELFLFLIVYANYVIMLLFIRTKIVYKHVICNFDLVKSVLCTAVYIEPINHYVNEGAKFIVVYLMQVKHLTEYFGEDFSIF